MAKNRFKYRCDDCGHEHMRSKAEFARRTRPRCEMCGSLALEPVTAEAKARMIEGEDARRIQMEKKQ